MLVEGCCAGFGICWIGLGVCSDGVGAVSTSMSFGSGVGFGVTDGLKSCGLGVLLEVAGRGVGLGVMDCTGRGVG